MFDKFFKGNEAYFYFVFRLFVGLLFAQHGAQKVLGWFTDSAPQVAGSLMWFVGLVELLGGLLIAVGLFTRLAAIGTGILALLIYFNAHAPGGLVPVMNKGELILLYFAAFLVVMAKGAGMWSLEKYLLGKEQ